MSDSPIAGVVGGVPTGVGMWQIYPALGVLIVRSASQRQQATALSAFGACFTAGVAIGSGSLGIVAQGFGYQTMFLAYVACVGVGLLVSLAASRVPGESSRRRPH